MPQIKIYNAQKKIPLLKKDQEVLRKFLNRVLSLETPSLSSKYPSKINIVITDNQYLKQLKTKYLGKREVTDVLAFPLGELGEVYVSLELAKLRKGKDFLLELFLYAIHGILHLLGYDHQTKSGRERMREREKYLLKFTNIE